MFSLFENMGLQAVMRREFVPFIVAFSIAEFLYKFKSFALECIAFLITWYLLSLLQSLFMRSQR